MAKAERFYPRIIDRTPYGACWVAGIIGVLIFGVGYYAIVRTASWLGSTSTAAYLQKQNRASADKSQELLDAAAAAAQDAADSANQAAKDAAAKKIEEEKKKATQAVIDEAKSQLQLILPSPSISPQP